jgi:hypothetical protein
MKIIKRLESQLTQYSLVERKPKYYSQIAIEITNFMLISITKIPVLFFDQP